MAHKNIKQRQQAVKDVIIDGKILSSVARELAIKFKCSLSAIKADVISFNNQHLTETYHVSSAKRKLIISRDKSICYLCGQKTNKPVVEHKKPASQGGEATLDNLAISCQSCNIKKRYRDNSIISIKNTE